MIIDIKFGNRKDIEPTKKHSRRLKSTCAKNCVPVRGPFGHVVIYAPIRARRLRLPSSPKGCAETRALHHIVGCRMLGTIF